MGAIAKHTPFRLSPEGYRQLCQLVDERDRGCAICGRPDVQHHHIIFRSAGGEDRLENLIALCPEHHRYCAHGEDEAAWAGDFLEEMEQPEAKQFAKDHQKELERIYKMQRR